MIQFNKVTKKFLKKQSTVTAIEDVSLTINKQERFGIIGESGAGKSTLLRFINALEKPSEGMVFVDGRDVQKLDKKELRLYRKEISMIFQHFNLLNNKTVEENIQMPLDLHNYAESISMENVLDFVGLKDKRSHYPTDLSGGEMQRVGIARALITRPKILLCDEPTSSLDLSTAKEIVNVLKKAHEEFSITIVVVTHDLNVIKELCTRAALLENGKLTDIVSIQPPKKQKEYISYRERALEVLNSGDNKSIID